MSLLQFKLSESYKTTTCITCGIVIALPESFYDKKLENGKNYYCPSGHSQHFVLGHTEEDKLKAQLDSEKRSNKFLRKQNEKERNRTRAQKGAKTRLKNRIKNGVCPCCNRTFKNLHNHMQNKHPDYTKEEAK